MLKRVFSCGTCAICALLLSGVAVAAERGSEAKEPCGRLPTPILLDAGKLKLERAGVHWTLAKAYPRSDTLVYIDHDDNRRVYEFKRWKGDEYSCIDTGRMAN